MASSPGQFIVIEGLEGAGKSTALTAIVSLLSALNINSLTTREPGGTPVGELLRDIIKNPDYKQCLDDKTELLLLYSSRIQLVEEVIKPALQQGTWVIADRFELSTLAYQGGGRNLDKRMIKELSDFCLKGFKPNLTLYLDINPEISMQRVRKRGKPDRIEQQAMEFFYRVHDTYQQNTQNIADIVTIDATLPLDEVTRIIQDLMHQFLRLKGYE